MYSLSDCQSESWLIAKSSVGKHLMEYAVHSVQALIGPSAALAAQILHSSRAQDSARDCNNVHKPSNKWTSDKSQTLLTIHDFVKDRQLRRHA